jgi:SAM-dependent methyltransferase
VTASVAPRSDNFQPGAAAERRQRPRRIIWLLLFGSAGGVLLTGIVGTVFVLTQEGGTAEALTAGFWIRLGVASVLTIASLMLRSLRWMFFLRRVQTRIPIRDAYIGYFSGLSLLLAPVLIGEIAVRAAVQRRRGGVPVSTTIVVNLWERWFDLLALVTLAGLLALATGWDREWALALPIVAIVGLVSPLRRACLAAVEGIARPAARWFDAGAVAETRRLAEGKAWLAALATSVVVWVLPGLGLWQVASSWDYNGTYSASRATQAYAAASVEGGVAFAPGGVLVTGAVIADELERASFPEHRALAAAFGIRLATTGVATMLGVVFLLVHFRSATSGASSAHFDEIADAYDVQIPEARREALLARKTGLMQEVLAAHVPSARRGLDAGCGQGWYVRRMRELGFVVDGIDTSPGQIAFAAQQPGGEGRVGLGSVLAIREPDTSFDFVYTINVLHHLGSIEEQRRAFGELLRVLKPGGLLFVHEINTRNILFRFYMGYVFPSLNCIDEGIERWLLPERMAMYTDAPVVDVRYFTFFPDFLPQSIVRLLSPFERLLERSPLKVYSAHYMAVVRKP